jgi:hypothetical protein
MIVECKRPRKNGTLREAYAKGVKGMSAVAIETQGMREIVDCRSASRLESGAKLKRRSINFNIGTVLYPYDRCCPSARTAKRL